nr:hypothetical protein L204_04061 [Cryptococcus depauperatus CBS 7855]
MERKRIDPLRIPFLVDTTLPTEWSGHALPVSPTHIAQWTVAETQAGPSKYTALAGRDNTIWVVAYPGASADLYGKQTEPLDGRLSLPSDPSTSEQGPEVQPPTFTYPRTSTPSTPGSLKGSAAFSPPPPTHQLPTATLSSATVSAAPPDQHCYPNGGLDHQELMEQLRNQQGAREGSTPLNFGGMGRRGLTGLHGQAEQESGVVSPRSSISTSTDATGTGILKLWARNTRSSDDERNKELREKMEEKEVERVMEKGRLDGQREQEERRVVGEAIDKNPAHEEDFQISDDHWKNHGCDWKDKKVWRIVLREAGRGKIVQLKVLGELGLLCVLRDEGLLDIFSLSNLQSVDSLDLEGPKVRLPKDPSSSKAPQLGNYWSWRGLHLVRKDSNSLFFVHALPWLCDGPSPNGEVTRVIGLTFDGSKFELLEPVVQLDLPEKGDVGFCSDSGGSYLIHATPMSLKSYSIITAVPSSSSSLFPIHSGQPRISSVAYPRSQTPTPESSDPSITLLRKSASSSHLAPASLSSLSDRYSHLRNHGDKEKSFARLLARREWSKKTRDAEKYDEKMSAVRLGQSQEVERDGYGHWANISLESDGHGAGWAENGDSIFKCDGRSMWVKGSISLSDQGRVRDVAFLKSWERVVLLYQSNKLEVWSREKNPRKEARLKYRRVSKLDDVKAILLTGTHRLLVACSDCLQAFELQKDQKSSILLKFSSPLEGNSESFSHILPSSLEDAFVSDSRGSVYRYPLDLAITQSPPPKDKNQLNVGRLEAAVTCMKIVQKNEYGARRYLVAGDEDGVIRVWTVDDFEFCGSWTLFECPVRSSTLLNMPQAGSIRGSLMCASEAGTIGLISLDNMELLYLIPAARTPLRQIYISQKDILIAYANGKARVWNTETQEFRRSTSLDAGEDMLQNGNWALVAMEEGGVPMALEAGVIQPGSLSQLGRLLVLDLREFGEWLHSSRNNPRHSPLSALRTLLSVFLTWGVSDIADQTCMECLGIRKPLKSSVTGYGVNSQTIGFVQGIEAWRMSKTLTGLRQLTIIALLRPFLDSPDHEKWAAEIIAFYAASLPATILEPELDFFASFYMDPCPDVHMASRILFAARVNKLVEAEIEDIVAARENDLPIHQPDTSHFIQTAVNALTVLGGIALQRYQCMKPWRVPSPFQKLTTVSNTMFSTLKAIAESINLYLHQPLCVQLSLAIELCSKGFTTWQTYVDPSDLLRRLFYLATNKELPSITSQSSTSLAAQARLAVLHVASSNAPLFMSTLSMDILDAKSTEARSSIMKLCVFMARKKPAVLENGLPRIAEAVVKSLDPNVAKMRDDVWQVATVILNELVQAGTQRLAVGTQEGAVIMYDLKTASRVYVLEPHKFPVSAICFSPDGRRLLTVSIDEGSVTVWKVGSSLSGFFSVGGPPRQGGKTGEPFKRIGFMRADNRKYHFPTHSSSYKLTLWFSAGPLDSTAALSDVQIMWLSARQARVKIKETALTFET